MATQNPGARWYIGLTLSGRELPMTDASSPASEPQLWPYLQLALPLADLPRKGGGTMFRHQLDTLAVLLEIGHTDPVLLAAAICHDLIEDVEGFEPSRLAELPYGPEVVDLVLEVSKRPGEPKRRFLERIATSGSPRARLLKVADRISNVTSLGLSDDPVFVRRYIKETEELLLPMARQVSAEMAAELEALVETRASKNADKSEG